VNGKKENQELQDIKSQSDRSEAKEGIWQTG